MRPSIRSMFVMAAGLLLSSALSPLPMALAEGETGSAAAAKDSPEESPQQEWDRLIARRDEITSRVEQLRKEFAEADEETKGKLTAEYRKLVGEFQSKISPRFLELAPAVFEQNPDNTEAGELIVALALQKNQFERVAQVAQQLVTGKHDSRFAVNAYGLAAFAMHDFERAKQVLEQAQSTGDLDPQLGERFLKPAADYIELWKNEQKIRETEQAASREDRLPRVLLKTSRGDVELELFENEAPNTVANFIELVEHKHYDGTRFHRVIPNFMAQGGDLSTRPDKDAQGDGDYTIDCECYRDDARKHFRGSLSMAHAGKDTGSTQFFITHLPTYWLNSDVDPKTVHTVFGRVVKGMEVVDALQPDDELITASVLSKRNHPYVPKRNH